MSYDQNIIKSWPYFILTVMASWVGMSGKRNHQLLSLQFLYHIIIKSWSYLIQITVMSRNIRWPFLIPTPEMLLKPQKIIPSEMEVAPHTQNCWYHTKHKTIWNTRKIERIPKQGIIERRMSGKHWPSRLRRSGCNIILAKLVWSRWDMDAVWMWSGCCQDAV